METLAYVGGSRWRIETEFETEKSDVGLDEYETRTYHHGPCACWADKHPGHGLIQRFPSPASEQAPGRASPEVVSASPSPEDPGW